MPAYMPPPRGRGRNVETRIQQLADEMRRGNSKVQKNAISELALLSEEEHRCCRCGPLGRTTIGWGVYTGTHTVTARMVAPTDTTTRPLPGC